MTLYFFPTVTLYCHKLPNRQGYTSDSRQSCNGQEQTAAEKVPRGEGEVGHQAEIKQIGRLDECQKSACLAAGCVGEAWESVCRLQCMGTPRGLESSWWSGFGCCKYFCLFVSLTQSCWVLLQAAFCCASCRFFSC